MAFALYVLSVLFLYFCTNLSLSEQPESLLSKDAAVSISLSLPLCFLLIGRLERYKNLPFWKRFALRLSIFLFFIIFLQLWVHPLGLCVAYIAFRGVSSDGFSVTAKVAETSHVVVTTEQKLEDLQPLFVEVIQNRCLHLPPAVRAHVYSELVKKAETYSRLFLEKGEQFADQLLDMDFLAAKETTTKLLELPILQPQLPVPPAPTPSIIDQTITFITAHPWLALFGITIVGVVVYT